MRQLNERYWEFGKGMVSILTDLAGGGKPKYSREGNTRNFMNSNVGNNGNYLYATLNLKGLL